MQKDKKLPERVEIILIDDGSKDKTLEYIKEMTVKYTEAEAGPTVFVRGLRQIVN